MTANDTPTDTGDVEALARVIAEAAPNEDGFVGEHTWDGYEVAEQDLIRTLARAILASDWLAARDAAQRAGERERIAQAIEALRAITVTQSQDWLVEQAADIARAGTAGGSDA